MFLYNLKKEGNITCTENGAATYRSSMSDCVDLFATIGALRSEGDAEIIARFVRAYTENPDIAIKILFFARDIREGLGERRIFRIIFNWLAENEPDSVRKNLDLVAEYGRYDDLMSLMGTPCEEEMLSVIKEQFLRDMAAAESEDGISLLAKWLPSVNTSSADARQIGKKWRRLLAFRRLTTEKRFHCFAGRSGS